ncbi:MAG: FAD-dependent oxidoreductase, partial [Chryseolinea sp.]
EFEYTSAFLFSQTSEETEQLQELYNASRDAGLALEYVNQIPISASFEKAIRIGGQGKFHPLKYLFAMAREYENLGGHIMINCKVDNAQQVDGEVHISTTEGEIRTKNIIYATHIPPGINLLHLRCAPWRSYALALKLENDAYPDGLVYDLKDPYYYYRTHVVDGEKYVIAGGEDHKTGEEENTDKPFLKLRAHAERIFKIKQVSHEWSSQYFESADGLPYIGILPGNGDNVYVATGFGGNGMIYSHMAAMELASKIELNESAFYNLFAPSRVKPVAAFDNFVDHNKDVVKHFLGKFFGSEKLEALAGIAPGEGRVVKFEGHSIAVSKDLHGKVYAVSSVCTHMGCHVSWNSTEASWDCPCHGARYSMSGRVLTGPATENLQTVELTSMIEAKH